jgi:hypothetical protein
MPKRLSTATLVLGVSGSGKTSLLATFAEYLWDMHQNILLLYSWDGGAIPTDLQKRIHQGLILFWRARTRSAKGLELETLSMATKGYWPKRIDVETGETDPAVPLVGPIQMTYTLRCNQGHPLKTVAHDSLIVPMLCPTCKVMITRDQLQIETSSRRTPGFEQVGGVAYDGLSSMTSVVMMDMDWRRGKGLIGGEKSAFGGTIQSGDEYFGGNNRADVGFAQTRAQQFVSNTLSIPFLKEGPVFTGLSTEGTDKGLSVVGVDLPGQAALTQAPQWFGNIVEAVRLQNEHGQYFRRLYLKPFTDAQGKWHLLKTQASPTGPVPDYLDDPPEALKQPFVQFNLGVVLKKLDEDYHQSLAEPREGVPGMPERVRTFGAEEPPAEPPPTAAAATPTPASPELVGAATPRSRPSMARPAMGGSPSMPPPTAKPPQRAPGQ